MTKLGWLGDWYALSTGFACVARNVLTRLKMLGMISPSQLAIGFHPVPATGSMPDGPAKVKVYNATLSARDTWDIPFDYPGGIPTYEVQGNDAWSRDCLREWLTRFPQEVMVVNSDLWMTAWTGCSRENMDSYGPEFIFYQPIDGIAFDGHLPAHYFVEKGEEKKRIRIDWAELMRRQHISVLYGAWGRAQYENDLIHKLKLPDEDVAEALSRAYAIPHGVDLNLFQPLPQHLSRASFDFPVEKQHSHQAFFVGMVATNQSRKNWPAAIRIMAEFMKRHDNVYFWPWTTMWPGNMDGWHLDELMGKLLPPKRVIRYAPLDQDKPIPHAVLARYYSVLDVHMLMHYGEGCGLPHLEAQACGRPSLALDYAGITDYFSDPFLRVHASPNPRVGSRNCILRPEIRESEALAKLEKLYASNELRHKLGRKGVDYARKHWDWDRIVASQWEHVVGVAKERYERRCMESAERVDSTGNSLLDQDLEHCAIRATSPARGGTTGRELARIGFDNSGRPV